MLQRVPDPDLDARSGFHGGTDAHADDLALVLPALRERLKHGEAGGTHLAGLPAQDVRPRGLESPVELVQANVVVADRPALLLEVDPEDEDRVDELGVAEVVAAEVILRADWVDPRRPRPRRPAAERRAHDLPGEATVHEFRTRGRPAVEPRVVERALLEARAFRRDRTHVGTIELA